MSGFLAWIEAQKPHIDSYNRYPDASNPHLADTNLVNLSVPLSVLNHRYERDSEYVAGFSFTLLVPRDQHEFLVAIG